MQCDRLNKSKLMITSLDIKNFKSLASCRIDNLKRVNLFLGKNNVGKSSLLEAISLYLSQASPVWIQTLMRDRGLTLFFSDANVAERVEFEKHNISSLYTGRDVKAFEQTALSVSARYDGIREKSIGIKIEYYIPEVFKHDLDSTLSGSPNFVSAKEAEKIPIALCGLSVDNGEDKRFFPFDGKGVRLSGKDWDTNFEFVRSNTFMSDNAEMFDRIAMTDLQQNLISALNIIDSRIRNINFLNDPFSATSSRVPIVVFEDSNTRYPLRSMGDGMNRLLSIILSMLNCKGGVLLIDEFENGLHYTTLCRLWQMIFKLANDLDIQVFATTHSNDCIIIFISADSNEDGTMRLENRASGVIAIPYIGRDELNYIRDNDVEVR